MKPQRPDGRLVLLPHIPKPGPDDHPLDLAMWAIADTLINPVSPDGTICDLRFINIPVTARHLARGAIGPVYGQAVIRPVDAPGGYRQWIVPQAGEQGERVVAEHATRSDVLRRALDEHLRSARA